MDQNKFSIKLRATNEGGLEFVATDPPTKPPKGTTSATVTVSDLKFTIEGSFSGLSNSPSNTQPRTLIIIPSIGLEFELAEGWGHMKVNPHTDTPVTRQAEPPAEPPHN
jgi:hypothetical protein